MWERFLDRPVGEPHQNGKTFLLNWGISLSHPIYFLYLIDRSAPGLSTFFIRWDKFRNLPQDSTSIQHLLEQFQSELRPSVRKGLPTNFPKKAAMVWDMLVTHDKGYDDWTELDKEVKWYGVLHHFFADLHQVADKQMDFVPRNTKYADVLIYPDLVISVPTDTESGLIPAIVVENGTVSTSFDVHKDAVKVLAETRLATTSSLSRFAINEAFCYGIANGGRKMSVTLNAATLGPNNARSYEASFVLPDEVRESEDLERKLFTRAHQVQLQRHHFAVRDHVLPYQYDEDLEATLYITLVQHRQQHTQ
jgi:hypothetical protein